MASKYPKRNRQKVYDEEIWESQWNNKNKNRSNKKNKQNKLDNQKQNGNSNRNEVLEAHCTNCNRIFKGDKRDSELRQLRQHQVECLKLDPKDSFLKLKFLPNVIKCNISCIITR